MARYTATLPAQTAAGADSTTMCSGVVDVGDDGGGSPIQFRALLIPPPGFTTVTGVVTNNATISFRQVRAGSVVGTVCSTTLAVGVNLVAETPLLVAGAMPLGASAPFRADDLIDILLHQNGAGIAIGAGIVAELQIFGR